MDDPRLKMSADREAYIKRLEGKCTELERQRDHWMSECERLYGKLHRLRKEAGLLRENPARGPHWYENAHK